MAGTVLPRRRYADGVEVSVIAMGGLVVAELEQAQADRLVSRSIDAGVNYFDVAPTYGNAEDRLAPAIQPHRDHIFLACKTTERTAGGAAAQLDASLRKLRTDHFDLYQFHGIASVEEARQVLAPGGAGETFVEARRQGKARFLGVSAHSVEAAMLMMEAMRLDSLMFPVNYACWLGGFGPQVVAAAKARGMACIALKAMAACPRAKDEPRKYRKCWYTPVDQPHLAALALRFTLAQGVVAAIPPGNEGLYEMALDVAAKTDLTQPPSVEEMAELRAAAAGAKPLFSG
ncbi:MAG: aldo/keto reductase [Phycisphaerae bacterium]